MLGGVKSTNIKFLILKSLSLFLEVQFMVRDPCYVNKIDN